MTDPNNPDGLSDARALGHDEVPTLEQAIRWLAKFEHQDEVMSTTPRKIAFELAGIHSLLLTTPPASSSTAIAAGESFLSQLRRMNTDRYHAWVGDGQDAGILFDAAELGGEVGELLNVVKKLEREERGWRGSRAAPEDFADECADVLICLDKLARRRGVDLEAATVAKFNATSDKVGLPHKLTPAPKVAGDTGAGE